jgi:signal peptidase I
MANLIEAWRTWRLRSRLDSEGKHLIGEARRILDKKGREIPQAVSSEIEAALTAAQAARKSRDIEQMRQTLTVLDERMDQHLQFARKSTVREYSESIVVAVAIALLLRAFVVEAFQIPSGSMIPTLEIGDHIFVSKFAYGVGIPFTNKKILSFHEPQRGDVIVFKYPRDQATDYIKRVVGLPGDKVEVRRNEIFINGTPMTRTLQNGQFTHNDIMGTSELWQEKFGDETHSTLHNVGGLTNYTSGVIPPRSVFVMGDNRDNSNDSRVWGTVPYELIKGKALIVWWSRDPSFGGWSPSGIADWFGSIRFRRFFHLVD